MASTSATTIGNYSAHLESFPTATHCANRAHTVAAPLYRLANSIRGGMTVLLDESGEREALQGKAARLERPWGAPAKGGIPRFGRQAHCVPSAALDRNWWMHSDTQQYAAAFCKQARSYGTFWEACFTGGGWSSMIPG